MPCAPPLPFPREQGWRSGESTHLPPVCPWLDFWTRHHIWVEFVVGSLLCSERFFSRYSGFPLSSKNNHFQIPIQSWNAWAFLNKFCLTLWSSMGKQIRYLPIILHSFTFSSSPISYPLNFISLIYFAQISSCHALQHRLVLNVLIRLFESPTPLDTLVEVRVSLLDSIFCFVLSKRCRCRDVEAESYSFCLVMQSADIYNYN